MLKILTGIFLSLIVFSSALASPLNVSHQIKDGQVKISWDKVSNATHYKVYRKKAGAEGRSSDLAGRINTTSYTDKTVKENEQYDYTIVAYQNTQEVDRGSLSNIGISTVSTTGSTPDSTASTGKKIPIGARFPGEPDTVDLVEHIKYVHKWAAWVGSLLAILMIVFAGFKYATSSGNPEGLQDAKDTIIGALIGLSIIILTYFLLQIFGVRVK